MEATRTEHEQTGSGRPFHWRSVGLPRAYPNGATVERMLRIRERVGNLFNRDNLGWAGARRDCFTTIDPFIGAFTKGHLAVDMARIPARFCAAAHDADPHPTGNESERHARMKHAAMLWMRETGATDARDEVECVGGRADVYSASADWVVECGNTRIGKLISCIECSERPLFTLIPYQSERYRDGRVRSLIALHFAWSPRLTQAVQEHREREARRTAEIMEAAWAKLSPDAPATSLAGGVV